MHLRHLMLSFLILLPACKHQFGQSTLASEDRPVVSIENLPKIKPRPEYPLKNFSIPVVGGFRKSEKLQSALSDDSVTVTLNGEQMSLVYASKEVAYEILDLAKNPGISAAEIERKLASYGKLPFSSRSEVRKEWLSSVVNQAIEYVLTDFTSDPGSESAFDSDILDATKRIDQAASKMRIPHYSASQVKKMSDTRIVSRELEKAIAYGYADDENIIPLLQSKVSALTDSEIALQLFDQGIRTDFLSIVDQSTLMAILSALDFQGFSALDKIAFIQNALESGWGGAVLGLILQEGNLGQVDQLRTDEGQSLLCDASLYFLRETTKDQSRSYKSVDSLKQVYLALVPYGVDVNQLCSNFRVEEVISTYFQNNHITESEYESLLEALGLLTSQQDGEVADVVTTPDMFSKAGIDLEFCKAETIRGFLDERFQEVASNRGLVFVSATTIMGQCSLVFIRLSCHDVKNYIVISDGRSRKFHVLVRLPNERSTYPYIIRKAAKPDNFCVK